MKSWIILLIPFVTIASLIPVQMTAAQANPPSCLAGYELIKDSDPRWDASIDRNGNGYICVVIPAECGNKSCTISVRLKTDDVPTPRR